MAPCRSALEAGVRQPIVHQVSDAVHRVLEEGGGGEHEHPDRQIDEGDDVEGGNESGEFSDVGGGIGKTAREHDVRDLVELLADFGIHGRELLVPGDQ